VNLDADKFSQPKLNKINQLQQI